MGVTQGQLAEMIGISPSQLSRWVNDPEQKPSERSIEAIAKVARVEVAWLRYGHGPRVDLFGERQPSPLHPAALAVSVVRSNADDQRQPPCGLSTALERTADVLRLAGQVSMRADEERAFREGMAALITALARAAPADTEEAQPVERLTGRGIEEGDYAFRIIDGPRTLVIEERLPGHHTRVEVSGEAVGGACSCGDAECSVLQRNAREALNLGSRLSKPGGDRESLTLRKEVSDAQG